MERLWIVRSLFEHPKGICGHAATCQSPRPSQPPAPVAEADRARSEASMHLPTLHLGQPLDTPKLSTAEEKLPGIIFNRPEEEQVKRKVAVHN